MIINSVNFKEYKPLSEHDCDYYAQIIDESLDPAYPEGSILGFTRKCAVDPSLGGSIVLIETPDSKQYVCGLDEDGYFFYNDCYELRYPAEDIKILGVMECRPIYNPKEKKANEKEHKESLDFDLQQFASERCTKCDNFEESFNDFLLDYAWIIASTRTNVRKMGHDEFISFLRDDPKHLPFGNPHPNYLQRIHNTIEHIAIYFGIYACCEGKVNMDDIERAIVWSSDKGMLIDIDYPCVADAVK